MKPTNDMIEYYDRRATHYEDVYRKPERQADLARLKAELAVGFSGRRLLEVACGTGYWTEIIAATAISILGIDASESVLEIARAKRIPRATFLRDDAFTLVLKNFPSPEELRQVLEPFGSRITIRQFEHFWWAEYEVRSRDRSELAKTT